MRVGCIRQGHALGAATLDEELHRRRDAVAYRAEALSTRYAARAAAAWNEAGAIRLVRRIDDVLAVETLRNRWLGDRRCRRTRHGLHRRERTSASRRVSGTTTTAATTTASGRSVSGCDGEAAICWTRTPGPSASATSTTAPTTECVSAATATLSGLGLERLTTFVHADGPFIAASTRTFGGEEECFAVGRPARVGALEVRRSHSPGRAACDRLDPDFVVTLVLRFADGGDRESHSVSVRREGRAGKPRYAIPVFEFERATLRARCQRSRQQEDREFAPMAEHTITRRVVSRS